MVTSSCDLRGYLSNSGAFWEEKNKKKEQGLSRPSFHFFSFFYVSVKTTCEPHEKDLRELITLAESCASSIEKLVLDGGKIPEVSLRILFLTDAELYDVISYFTQNRFICFPYKVSIVCWLKKP